MPETFRKLVLAAALAAALALPAVAVGSVGSIYGDYSKDGSIDGCDYSPSDLNGALGSVPTDVAQYDPRFIDSLNKALSDRSCGAGGGTAAAATAAAGKGNGGAGSPVAVGPHPASRASDNSFSSDRGLPAALAVLAGVVALILLGTGAVALIRRKGWSPGGGRFLAGVRGMLSEYYWGLRDQLGR